MSKRRTDGGDYEVGFKKPPKHTQFQPGSTANPKGRPRKAKGDQVNISAIIREAAFKKHTITFEGRQVKMSYLQLAVEQMLRSHATGKSRDFKDLLAVVRLAILETESEQNKGGVDYGAVVRAKLDQMAERWKEERARKDDPVDQLGFD